MLLHDIDQFKDVINEPVGQEARMVIKRSMQKVDPEWLITLLRKMKDRKVSRQMTNPWNAYESAFAEYPFEVFCLSVGQVAMGYRTMKDHLKRHAVSLSPRPTGSLWEYIPSSSVLSTQFPQPRVAEEENPQPHAVQSENVANAAMVEEEEGGEEEEEESTDEDDDDVRSQWVKHMMNVQDAPMSFKSKVANATIALLAIALGIAASSSSSTPKPVESSPQVQ